MNFPSWLTSTTVLIAALVAVAWFFPSLIQAVALVGAGLLIGWNLFPQPDWVERLWDKIFE